MNNIKQVFSIKNPITVPRIAIIGMLLALLITLKYAFGFILGIELISFMFIFFGIFLPAIDLILLISCFNLLVLVVYGFGSWWLMYWIIWPVDAFVSKGISKFTTNRYVFAFWGFIAGMSVFFWYFISDILFFGTNFAILNIITAIPVNTIEGLTTMIGCIVIAPVMAKVFNQYSHKFWPNKVQWEFKEVKNEKANQIILGIMVILAITAIVLLFIYNQWFIDMKQILTPGKGDAGAGAGA